MKSPRGTNSVFPTPPPNHAYMHILFPTKIAQHYAGKTGRLKQHLQPPSKNVKKINDTIAGKTRKLCYRKDDRAMRPMGALIILGTP